MKESKEYDMCVLKSRKKWKPSLSGVGVSQKGNCATLGNGPGDPGESCACFLFVIDEKVDMCKQVLFFFFESFIHSFPISLVLTIFHLFIYSSNIYWRL